MKEGKNQPKWMDEWLVHHQATIIINNNKQGKPQVKKAFPKTTNHRIIPTHHMANLRDGGRGF